MLEVASGEKRVVGDDVDPERIRNSVLAVQRPLEPRIGTLGGPDDQGDVVAALRHGRAHVHDLNGVCEPRRISCQVEIADPHAA